MVVVTFWEEMGVKVLMERVTGGNALECRPMDKTVTDSQSEVEVLATRRRITGRWFLVDCVTVT